MERERRKSDRVRPRWRKTMASDKAKRNDGGKMEENRKKGEGK